MGDKIMYCGSCGNQIGEKERFCTSCGSEQTRNLNRPEVQYVEEKGKLVCPNCGRESRENTKFCPGCGKALPGLKVKRIPLCVLCGSKLNEGDKNCDQCGTAYREAEDGYISITENCCGSCGASTINSEAFCCECGTELANHIVEKKKKLLPVCRKCGREINLGHSFCANCGEVTTISKVKPILADGRITCPSCGESGMLPNRKICFRCGVEFLPTPWVCRECGKTNYYSSGKCIYCHPEGAQQKPRFPVAATTEPEPVISTASNSRPAPKKRAPTPSDFYMKWYYFLIYVLLIGGAIGSFITGIVSLVDGAVFMGLASLFLGVDALVTRSALANFRSSGPGQLIGYLVISYAVNLIDTLIKYNDLPKYASETEGAVYLLMMLFGAIAALIQICCNVSYFNKRKCLFVN